MADERSRRPTGAVPAGGTPTPPAHPARDPRAAVVVPVRFRYESFIDFIESQAMNISRSGMFLASDDPLPVGTIIDFELTLVDGFPLLRGKGDVVRTNRNPAGVGIRFQQLDDGSRKLLDRIIQVN